MTEHKDINSEGNIPPLPPELPDADNSPQDQPQMKEPRAKKVKNFKCPSCGGKLQFAPGSEAQKCPYCAHEIPVIRSEADIEELDYNEYLSKLQLDEQLFEQLTVKCPECAAEVSSEANITSQPCPYCGTDIVTTAKSSKQIKPASLLPFRIQRKKARELFKKWIAKLWFAPNDLKKVLRQEERFNGIYVPYWTYDSDTVSFYTGMRGVHYYTTEHYTDSKGNRRSRRVRHTRWYPTSGTVWESFNDVLVLASNSLPRKYTEKLEPWDLPNLVGYQDEYLSGFKAESYQIDLPGGFRMAQPIMDKEIRREIRYDIGGDEQRITSVSTQYNNVTFKHILLPIWISAYRYKNKIYRMLVNARTGEVQGERPWSWIKITLATLAAAIIITAIVLVIMHYQQGNVTTHMRF